MEHLAGYRLATNIDDLTLAQEFFVILAAQEEIKMRIRLAGGGEMPETARVTGTASQEDSYGKCLEDWHRQHEVERLVKENLKRYINKPL